MSDEKNVAVRVQATTSDKTKALRQYEALKASGKIEAALVIAVVPGGYHLLGQGLSLQEIGVIIAEAGSGVINLMRQQRAADREFKINDPLPIEGPPKKDPNNFGRKREAEVGRAKDGTLIPPPDEEFVACGECGSGKFYVTDNKADHFPARYVCTSCGNEIKLVRVSHPTGSA